MLMRAMLCRLRDAAAVASERARCHSRPTVICAIYLRHIMPELPRCCHAATPRAAVAAVTLYTCRHAIIINCCCHAAPAAAAPFDATLLPPLFLSCLLRHAPAAATRQRHLFITPLRHANAVRCCLPCRRLRHARY